MNKSESEAVKGFFILPKALILSPEYSDLSTKASVLYALMLDRASLSEKNNWKDENGQPFIYYTVSSVAEALKCSEPIAVKLIKELERKNLISKERSGQGKPTKFRVRQTEEFKKAKHSDLKSLNSESSENEIQEFKKFKSNNTENNNTEFINTLLYDSAEEEVKENIDYDCLIMTENKDEIDNIVSIIVNTLESKSKNVRIGSEMKTREDVCKKLLSLNSEHILYVLELMCTNKTQIRDIRGYLLKLLYYAPMTMSVYYSAKVSADMNSQMP